MRILVDLDNVLNQLAISWYAAHDAECKTCETTVTVDMVTEWDVSKFFTCGKDIYRYLLYEDIYVNAPVENYAIEATEQLQWMGHDLYVVTASENPYAIIGKYKWLEKYFPHISTKNVIVTYNKDLVRGDIIIDDRLENMMHSAPKRILFDQPWNRTLTPIQATWLKPYPYHRAKGWHEVLSIIEDGV